MKLRLEDSSFSEFSENLDSNSRFSSSQIMMFLWGFWMLLDLREEVAYPSQFYNMVFKRISCKGKIETMNTLPVTFLTFILSQKFKVDV